MLASPLPQPRLNVKQLPGTSRKRKQTKFFGSPVKDDQPQAEVSTAGLSKKVKTERRSNPIETIKPGMV